MSELNEAQREALMASADRHEEAAESVNRTIDTLEGHGYMLYALELRDVVIRMIRHVDTARDLARKR